VQDSDLRKIREMENYKQEIHPIFNLGSTSNVIKIICKCIVKINFWDEKIFCESGFSCVYFFAINS